MNLWDIIPDEDQYLLNQIIFSEGYKRLESQLLQPWYNEL